MSAALLGTAFGADMGTRSRKLVLLKLVDCCRDDGTKIFPSVGSIAAAAQCTSRQVQRELAAMQEIGLLRLVKAGGKGPKSTNEYALDIQTLQTIALRGWAKAEAAIAKVAESPLGTEEARNEVAAEANEKGDVMSPLAEKGDITDTKRVTSLTDKGDASVTQSLKEPLEEPLARSERERAGARDSDLEGDPVTVDVPDRELLDELRQAHPGSAHDDQWAVETAWAALTPEERVEAHDRIGDWVASKRSRQHILGLPKYLAQKLWTLLPEKAAAAEKVDPSRAGLGDGKVRLEAFSRAWWWIWFRTIFIDPVRARRAANLALQHAIGWTVPREAAPSDADAEAMAKIPRDSDEARAWKRHLAGKGVHDMPRPDQAEWIFVPSAWPPDKAGNEEQSIIDEAAEALT